MTEDNNELYGATIREAVDNWHRWIDVLATEKNARDYGHLAR